MNITKRKETLKERFGDRYMEFMNDLSNITIPHIELSKKWNISTTSLQRIVDDLKYSRTGRIKQAIRTTYRINRRIKKRREVMNKFLDMIAKSKNIT